MTCPSCGERSKVLRTRQEGRTIVRRRGCLSCGHRWTTIERDAKRGRLEGVTYYYDARQR